MGSSKQDLRAPAPAADAAAEDALERIKAALQGLRYGAVTALVQDGVVVLVERTEKVRLSRREQRA